MAEIYGPPNPYAAARKKPGMNPDRFIEKKAREESYGPPNPYTSLQKRQEAAKAAAPKSAPAKKSLPAKRAASIALAAPPPVEVAPISLDPMDALPPAMPAALRGMPALKTGPGAQDMRSDKYGQDHQRGKSLNVYQDPSEYFNHLNTVMQAPLMQDLARGAEGYKDLRTDFLKNAPIQADLSSVMGFADYMADGKGTARASYQKPGSYNDMVGKLASLMGEEQGARQQMAQLAFQQAGPLKKGQEEAQVRTQSETGREQGYRTPQPRSASSGGGNPLNQALAIQRAFQGLPPYKEAEKEIQIGQSMREIVRNPNWLSDFSLRGQMIQAMKIAPVSELEMKQFGMGSPDLFNKIRNMVGSVSSGRTLSPQDYKALEEFAAKREQYGRKKMEMIQTKFAEGLGPYSVNIPESGIMGITNPSISPNVGGGQDPAESEDMKSFDKKMNSIFGGK